MFMNKLAKLTIHFLHLIAMSLYRHFRRCYTKSFAAVPFFLSCNQVILVNYLLVLALPAPLQLASTYIKNLEACY
jgi:hypothetical protein